MCITQTGGSIMAKVTVNQDLCIGCEACVNACPSGVFEMNADGKAEAINQGKCAVCMSCVETCPVDAITVTEE